MKDKIISFTQLESMMKDFDFKVPGIMDSFMDEAIKNMAEQKEKIIAFLILFRAVYDDISPRQVLSRYEIEEFPIEDPLIKDFCDMENRPLKFEIETQLRLVPRKKRFVLTKDKWLDCKVSLLQTLNKVFNAKQVKDEQESTNSQENPQTSAKSVAKSQS